MDYWLQNYLLSFSISVILSGLILPNIMNIAFRRKLFDDVSERKIHRGVVPRLGGFAFLPALIFSFCVVIGCNFRFSPGLMTPALDGTIVPVFFLLCSLMLMYVVGLADDLIGVRYRAKFVLQIITGILIVMSGCWIHSLDGLFMIHDVPTILGWSATVFLVVYVVNAINLIDGIDGLASGLCIIALGYYSYIFFTAGIYVYSFLAAATMGSLMPFFYFNVFGSAENHTKIFMGDTGSLTIGVMLSFLTLEVFCMPPNTTPAGENIFILAVAPIMLPCFDVIRVFFHRVKRRTNPFLPDKCHIHHKMLALGYRQRSALIIILAADALFILFNILASPYIPPTAIFLADILGWTLINVAITHLIRIRERNIGASLYN